MNLIDSLIIFQIDELIKDLFLKCLSIINYDRLLRLLKMKKNLLFGQLNIFF